jgi:hypothetical protein
VPSPVLRRADIWSARSHAECLTSTYARPDIWSDGGSTPGPTSGPALTSGPTAVPTPGPASPTSALRQCLRRELPALGPTSGPTPIRHLAPTDPTPSPTPNADTSPRSSPQASATCLRRWLTLSDSVRADDPSLSRTDDSEEDCNYVAGLSKGLERGMP